LSKTTRSRFILCLIAALVVFAYGGCTPVPSNGSLSGFSATVSVPSPQDQAAFNDMSPVAGEGAPARIVSPSNYDFLLGKEKGLCDDNGFTETYFEVQALYRSCIEQYLMQELGLGSIDSQIGEGLSGAVANSREDMGFYQRYSILPLSYVYLRNNIYVERLSLDDLGVLERAVKDKDFEITGEIYEVVLRTYPEVLRPQKDKPPDFPVSYGANPTEEVTTNGAIVFGIGVSALFDGKGNFVDREGYVSTKDAISNELVPGFDEAASSALKGVTVCFFLE